MDTTVVTPKPRKSTASKTKEKKPVKVVAVVTPDGIDGSFLPEPRRPLIAHLQIRPNELQFHDSPLQYDPTPPKQPEPFDAQELNLFSSGQEVIASPTVEEDAEERQGTAVQPQTQTQTQAQPQPIPCFTRADLMVQFANSAKAKQLPSETSVACFWCAHSFSGMPCIIPEREVGGTYMVYGNFCSPECGVSYLLGENLDPHVRWERMALLQRIYDRDGTCRIFPAPGRECLELFGGPVSIGEFRATIREGKVRVDTHMPPMVSILGSIDTKPIDFFDTTLKGAGVLGVLPSSDTMNRAEEGLRLKRTKPLKDRDSTLDTVMNIQIGGKKKKTGLI
jgi:hypothetical protein